jgi:hypothetical protein
MADFLSLVVAQFRVAHFVPVNEILSSNHRAYLDLIPRGGSPSAEGFRAWFFANARRFDGGGDGSTMPAVRSFLGKFGHRQKDAFLAAQALAESDGLAYWEGYALHTSLPVQAAIHHAWNTADDLLLDISWAKGHKNGNLYLGVPVPAAFLERIQAELASGGMRYHGPAAFLSWAMQESSEVGPPSWAVHQRPG